MSSQTSATVPKKMYTFDNYATGNLKTTNNNHQLELVRSRFLLKITKKILLNAQKGNPMTLTHSDNVVESVAISSDGKYMISGSKLERLGFTYLCENPMVFLY